MTDQTYLRADPPKTYPANVAALYQDFDNWGDLLLRVALGSEEVRLSVLCSDFFAWACADEESIDPEDYPLLLQCAKDLEAIEWENKKSVATAHLSELFCCRKRKQRPMNAWLYGHNGRTYCEPDVVHLFEECGDD